MISQQGTLGAGDRLPGRSPLSSSTNRRNTVTKSESLRNDPSRLLHHFISAVFSCRFNVDRFSGAVLTECLMFSRRKCPRISWIIKFRKLSVSSAILSVCEIAQKCLQRTTKQV